MKEKIKKWLTDRGEMDKVPHPYILIISIFEVAEYIRNDEGLGDANIFELVLFTPLYMAAVFFYYIFIWLVIAESWREREKIWISIILIISVLCYKLGLIDFSEIAY